MPNDLKDDNIFPSVFEIPSFLTSMRHPRRSRAVSIGPQSEADAYETLAYRDKRRRDSMSSLGTSPKKLNIVNHYQSSEGHITVPSSDGKASRLPVWDRC